MTSKLRAVPDAPPPPLDMAGDIYADVRKLAHDPERWAKMHLVADKRLGLDIHEPRHRRSWASWDRL